jgi:two-component system alkaline phosphatase synthesis response regulator PhoP
MATKILLVDDEKDIVEFLQYNLEQEGFEVLAAYDGKEALEKMELNPDLVILDVFMQKMDGYEVCTKIRLMVLILEQMILFRNLFLPKN